MARTPLQSDSDHRQVIVPAEPLDLTDVIETILPKDSIQILRVLLRTRHQQTTFQRRRPDQTDIVPGRRREDLSFSYLINQAPGVGDDRGVKLARPDILQIGRRIVCRPCLYRLMIPCFCK